MTWRNQHNYWSCLLRVKILAQVWAILFQGKVRLVQFRYTSILTYSAVIVAWARKCVIQLVPYRGSKIALSYSRRQDPDSDVSAGEHNWKQGQARLTNEAAETFGCSTRTINRVEQATCGISSE